MAKTKMVKITPPRTPGDTRPYVIVGYQGKLYQIPKGKSSEVPEAVAIEFLRAEGAALDRDNNAERLAEQMVENGKASEEEAKKSK